MPAPAACDRWHPTRAASAPALPSLGVHIGTPREQTLIEGDLGVRGRAHVDRSGAVLEHGGLIGLRRCGFLVGELQQVLQTSVLGEQFVMAALEVGRIHASTLPTWPHWTAPSPPVRSAWD